MRMLLFIFVIAIIGITRAPKTALACACCETWQVVNVAQNDVLNIRSGPGSRYNKVGSIPSGSACVNKTGECFRHWCKISYAGFDGWVSTRYLRFKN